MKRSFTIAGALLGFVVLYLLAWPVPIQPVRWQAPVDRGLTDPFEANDQLQAAVGIKLDEFRGPEDATLGIDGKLYVTHRERSYPANRRTKRAKFCLCGRQAARHRNGA